MKSRLVSWKSVWILAALAFVLIVATVVISLDEVNKTTLPPYVAAPTSPDDWPSYLHDLQHTADSADTTFTPANVSGLVKLWSFQAKDAVATSATVVANTVYVGSWDGYEYALNASTGALKWKTFLGTRPAPPDCFPPTIGISSSAAFQNGVLYVGGGDAYWYALDAKTGKVLWKVYTGSIAPNVEHYNWASPTLYQGYAYIGISSYGTCPSVQGQVLKVNLQTHQVVGTLNFVPNGQQGAEVWGTPAVDTATNTLFVTTGNKTIDNQPLAESFIAIDLTTFKIRDSWQDPVAAQLEDSDIGASPTLFSDTAGDQLVTATGKDGLAYALKRGNLKAGPVWKANIGTVGDCPECGDGSVSSGAFGNGMLYLAGGNTIINGVGYVGSVRGIDPATGKFLWQHGDQGIVLGALAYTNGLVMDDSGSTFEVLNAANGQRLFSYQTGGLMYGAPSIAENKIFFGSSDGNLYALGLPGSPPAQPPGDANCPNGWTCQDIGAPGAAGSESVTQQTWQVSASGAGFSGDADQGRLLTQSASGDTQISAQVVSQQPPGGSTAQSGLLIRQTSAADSPYYGVFFKEGQGLMIQYRSAFGGGTTTQSVTQNIPTALPLYLEIQRTGDLFQAAYSTSGFTYTLLPGSSITLILPARALVGLAASAGKAGAAATTTFRAAAIGAPQTAPNTLPLTTFCPFGWNCADIGNPGLGGTQTLRGGAWTIQAGGSDIWETWDQFHFVWQALNGDGTISAQVVTQQVTDPSAKAGVMLRAGTEANAAYYAVFVTPGGGIQVQYRVAQGYNARNAATISGKAPVYLRVARVGNTFTAYTSDDGRNWAAVPYSSFTLTMPSTLLAGLAVTSHNAAELCSVTINTVTIG
jgi:outer membrane protein assembly factor BamB